MFTLTIKIDEKDGVSVDSEGSINHLVLMGVLESLKIETYQTSMIMAAQAAKEALGVEQNSEAIPGGDE